MIRSGCRTTDDGCIATFNTAAGDITVRFDTFGDYYTFIDCLEKDHAKAILIGENSMKAKLRALIGEDRMTETILSENMVNRANQDGLPEDHEIRLRAKEFDDAAIGFYGSPQTVNVKKFLGIYARTRRVWCEYSGDSLV